MNFENKSCVSFVHQKRIWQNIFFDKWHYRRGIHQHFPDQMSLCQTAFDRKTFNLPFWKQEKIDAIHEQVIRGDVRAVAGLLVSSS